MWVVTHTNRCHSMSSLVNKSSLIINSYRMSALLLHTSNQVQLVRKDDFSTEICFNRNPPVVKKACTNKRQKSRHWSVINTSVICYGAFNRFARGCRCWALRRVNCILHRHFDAMWSSSLGRSWWYGWYYLISDRFCCISIRGTALRKSRQLGGRWIVGPHGWKCCKSSSSYSSIFPSVWVSFLQATYNGGPYGRRPLRWNMPWDSTKPFIVQYAKCLWQQFR